MVEIDDLEDEEHVVSGSIIPYASKDFVVHGLDEQPKLVDDIHGLEEELDLVADLHGLEEQPKGAT